MMKIFINKSFYFLFFINDNEDEMKTYENVKIYDQKNIFKKWQKTLEDMFLEKEK